MMARGPTPEEASVNRIHARGSGHPLSSLPTSRLSDSWARWLGAGDTGPPCGERRPASITASITAWTPPTTPRPLRADTLQTSRLPSHPSKTSHNGSVPDSFRAQSGKSSLTIQFVEGQFVDSYDPTIENTFTKLITVNGQEYHLQLVDTAGQDEYSIFPQTYSIDINGYILVYSVTSIKSFEVIKVIHGKLLDMVGKVQIPIMLVGNKKDLHMERVISYEEGKALAESWNAAFLESSAKENQTAVDVFRRIILEAEKIDGAASQGKSSCSVM
nr:PREDICTED: GTP-binding protein Rheb [Bos mutus]